MTRWAYIPHVGGQVMGPKYPVAFAGYLRALADVAVTHGSMSASRRQLIHGRADELAVTWRP
jgi:hypothetical protein